MEDSTNSENNEKFNTIESPAKGLEPMEFLKDTDEDSNQKIQEEQEQKRKMEEVIKMKNILNKVNDFELNQAYARIK